MYIMGYTMINSLGYDLCMGENCPLIKSCKRYRWNPVNVESIKPGDKFHILSGSPFVIGVHGIVDCDLFKEMENN